MAWIWWIWSEWQPRYHFSLIFRASYNIIRKKEFHHKLSFFYGHSNPTNNDQNPLSMCKHEKSFFVNNNIATPGNSRQNKAPPLEIPQVVLDPLWKFQQSQRPRPLEIPHYFFLVTLRNSTSFLINVWKFILFLSPLVKIPYPPCGLQGGGVVACLTCFLTVYFCTDWVLISFYILLDSNTHTISVSETLVLADSPDL